MAGAAPRRRDATFDRMADWAVRPRSRFFRWGFAALAFAVALALRLGLDPVLPEGIPFLTFFPAVALTAFFAGVGPGIAVAVACLVVAWHAFIPPFWSFVLDGPAAVALVLYVIVSATEVVLVHLMRRSLARLAEAQAQAQAAAHRGMLMFAELQHRVSNNLGVVGSLLALQRRRVTDPMAVRALEEAERRVGVVSRLSRLLVDPEAQEVDFGAFLRALVPDVVAAAAAEERVAVTVAAEPISVTAASAVPLGLIAAELISNAIEHGFPAGRAGRIDVRLASHGDERALLLIQDDGAGLPDGFDVTRARSLGLTIARQFAGQMGALLSMEGGQGALARLDFPTTA